MTATSLIFDHNCFILCNNTSFTKVCSVSDWVYYLDLKVVPRQSPPRLFCQFWLSPSGTKTWSLRGTLDSSLQPACLISKLPGSPYSASGRRSLIGSLLLVFNAGYPSAHETPWPPTLKQPGGSVVEPPLRLYHPPSIPSSYATGVGRTF